jgi:hypothetical protein
MITGMPGWQACTVNQLTLIAYKLYDELFIVDRGQ